MKFTLLFRKVKNSEETARKASKSFTLYYLYFNFHPFPPVSITYNSRTQVAVFPLHQDRTPAALHSP